MALPVLTELDRTFPCRVWDMLSGRCVHVLGGHAGRINAVRVANDNKTVITVSDDYTAKVFDLQTGRAMCAHACSTSCPCT